MHERSARRIIPPGVFVSIESIVESIV